MRQRDRATEQRHPRPRIDVEALRDRWPLDDLAQRYGVAVRGRGTRRYARCLFHDDRSPSLVLYLTSRTWFCFGCRQWGDAIDWVMRLESLDFLEACRFLGATLERHGPNRPRRAPTPDPYRQGLPGWALDVLRATADIYRDALARSPEGLRYVRSRGIGAHAMAWAQLGYATGRDLDTGLRQRGVPLEAAREVGLLNARGHEALWGRLVVPVIRGGAVVTLAGRAVLPGLQRRYLDLPLPPHALGADLVLGQPRVVLVEGVVDYLLALQWQVLAVSPMGTHASDDVRAEIQAATEAAELVPLAFDDDEGGREATQQWQEWLGHKAVPVRWPRGVNDLGDLGTRPDGPSLFFQMLADAEARSRADRRCSLPSAPSEPAA